MTPHWGLQNTDSYSFKHSCCSKNGDVKYLNKLLLKTGNVDRLYEGISTTEAEGSCFFESEQSQIKLRKKYGRGKEHSCPSGIKYSELTITLKQQITTVHIEEKLCPNSSELPNHNSSNLNGKLFRKASLVTSASGLYLKLSQWVRRASRGYEIWRRHKSKRTSWVTPTGPASASEYNVLGETGHQRGRVQEVSSLLSPFFPPASAELASF